MAASRDAYQRASNRGLEQSAGRHGLLHEHSLPAKPASSGTELATILSSARAKSRVFVFQQDEDRGRKPWPTGVPVLSDRMRREPGGVSGTVLTALQTLAQRALPARAPGVGRHQVRSHQPEPDNGSVLYWCRGLVDLAPRPVALPPGQPAGPMASEEHAATKAPLTWGNAAADYHAADLRQRAHCAMWTTAPARRGASIRLRACRSPRRRAQPVPRACYSAARPRSPMAIAVVSSHSPSHGKFVDQVAADAPAHRGLHLRRQFRHHCSLPPAAALAVRGRTRRCLGRDFGSLAPLCPLLRGQGGKPTAASAAMRRSAASRTLVSKLPAPWPVPAWLFPNP